MDSAQEREARLLEMSSIKFYFSCVHRVDRRERGQAIRDLSAYQHEILATQSAEHEIATELAELEEWPG